MPRFHFARLSFAREKATLLRKALDALGHDVTLTQARDVYAGMCGYRDFHELAQTVKAGRHDPSPLVEDVSQEDVDFLGEVFGIRQEAAAKLLGQVRPRAMGGEAAAHAVYRWFKWPSLPKLRHLEFEQALLDRLRPHSGLFLVTGGRNSGKETLLASIMAHLADRPGNKDRIFDLADVGRSGWLVSSPWISRYTVSPNGVEQEDGDDDLRKPPMADVVMNAMRRAPDVMVVGQTLDMATLSQVVDAALTGHMMYSTMPCENVAQTLDRMAAFYPPRMRDAVGADILAALHGICSQILVETSDEEWVALREYLVFDDKVRRRLASRPMTEWSTEAVRIMDEGWAISQTIAKAAQEAYARRRIDVGTRDRVLSGRRSLAEA